ncbi:MAG: transposase [Kofleriaceae bacterium]
MPRSRKRHAQQSLHFGDPRRRRTQRSRRRNKSACGGRPPKGPRSSERHKTREVFRKGQPVHVVIRAIAEIRSLRTRGTYLAIRKALVVTFTREDFRIVHLSIQDTHVHLLVEADHREALARGMKAFQISAAKHLNAAISARRSERRRGSVFPDRYHAVVIRSPRQARSTLAYVLNNWRKHGEHRANVSRGWEVDLFSSGLTFDGWRDLETVRILRPGYPLLPVWRPRTWLLGQGWRKHGLISTTEVPSERVLRPVE